MWGQVRDNSDRIENTDLIMALTTMYEINIWTCHASTFQALMCTYAFKLMASFKTNDL